MAGELVGEFLETCVTGPNVWATGALVLLLVYGLVVLLGAASIDLFDLDADLPGGKFHSLTDLGILTLRFLNVGTVPLVVWYAVFSISWWAISMLLWQLWDRPTQPLTTQQTILLTLRNVGLAVCATKLITQPFVSFFNRLDAYGPIELIGRPCEVSTYRATPDWGQARFKTDGAPLLLNVRTTGPTLEKGTTATIVDYDEEKRVYYIAAEPESTSEDDEPQNAEEDADRT